MTATKSIEAFRSPKIECIVVQHPWLENDTVFADIILPINTKLEEEDIALFNMVARPAGVWLSKSRLSNPSESP